MFWRRSRRARAAPRRFARTIALVSFLVLVVAIPILLGFAISWIAGVIAAAAMVMLWDWMLGR